MTTTSAPTRVSGFASTATTVVALLAVASAARMLPVGEYTTVAETRTTVRESSVVRAVAEVMAAAARDLLSGEHTTAALSAGPPEQPHSAAPVTRMPGRDAGPLHRVTALDERLIDLPPPTA